MHLRDARLCLDCEELHTLQQCPVCASETFSFVTRWIPSDDDVTTREARDRRRLSARQSSAREEAVGDR
jgi:hypothetical protein